MSNQPTSPPVPPDDGTGYGAPNGPSCVHLVTCPRSRRLRLTPAPRRAGSTCRQGGGALAAELFWRRVGLAGQRTGPPHVPAEVQVQRGDQQQPHYDGVEQDAERDRETQFGQ